MTEHPVLFLVNAALVILVVARLGSSREPDRYVAIRLVVLSLILFLETCFFVAVAPRISTLAYLVVLVCLSSVLLAPDMTRSISRLPGPGVFGVYVLSVATVAALAFVHLPIMTFLTSPGEIGIHLDYLLSTNARDAMVVVYVSAGAYALALSPRMRSVLSLLALTVLMLALVYSYLLPFGYPMMSGLMFERIPLSVEARAVRVLFDQAVVAAVALGAFFLLTRLGPKRILGGILLLNVSLVIASGISIARDTSRETAQGAVGSGTPGGPLLQFSTTGNNVLIIMLDRLMGGFVEGILEEEPELATRLDGFTWYPRTIAAGENSIAGVHPIFGGYDYLPREMNARGLPLRDVSAESFSILPFNFRRMGYRVNVVNPKGLGFTIEGDCSFLDVEGVNCTNVPLAVAKEMAEDYGMPMRVLSESNYADLLSLLGLMRSAPYSLKAVLYARGPWRPFLDHSAGTTFRHWGELKSLPDLTSVDSAGSTYNQVFNILPHEPYFLNEACFPVRSELDVSAQRLEALGYPSLFAYQHAIGARCSLLLVADYFEWLKSVDVYDNTKIVIVSDHGIVGPVEDPSSRARAGGTTDEIFVRSRSVLFVKEAGAHGPLKTSEEFLPNAEVPRIVCEEIGGCVNPFLGNRRIATDGRDDPFYVASVPWQFNLQDPDGFVIEREMEMVGRDPYDRRGWREIRRD